MQSSGTASPPTVATGEGTYDFYRDPLPPYPMYGPPVYQPNKSQADNRATMVQNISVKLDGCILVRDNWCAFEFPSYLLYRRAGLLGWIYVLQPDITA